MTRMTEGNAATRTDQSRGLRELYCTERLERKLRTLGDPFLQKLRSEQAGSKTSEV
jgi:hypothetical protein